MTRRYWGTLYFVDPSWSGDPGNSSESVVNTYRNGPSDLQVAIEIWHMIGDDERVKAIKDLLDKANARDNPVLFHDETAQLISALDGIEEAAQKGLVDRDGRVAPDRIAALRNQSKLLDFDDLPDRDPALAVHWGLTRVSAVRDGLRSAYERNLNVALD